MKTRKSPKANLENKRGIFFQVGLVTALAAVFFAFEWKTFDTKKIKDIKRRPPEEVETLPPITKPKPPPPPKAPSVLNPVSSEIETKETEIISPEILPNTPIPQYILHQPTPETPVEEPEFFTAVEESPSFPGGFNEMKKFLRSNTIYPELAREMGISGKVYVEFIVEKDGSITNINLLWSVGGGCDEEAIRIVKLMPKWNPGKQRNIPVRVKMSLPVNFVLK